jgi:hypothetical protein
MIAVIGFPAGTALARSALDGRTSVDWVDLDLVDAGEPLVARPGSAMVVMARTLTDLRRAVSMGGILPPTRWLIIAVTQASRPLVGLPLDPREQRFVQRVDAHRNADGWSVGITMSRAVPSGRLLTSIVVGRRKNRSRLMPSVALSGPGAAHWRPGDPSAAPTTAEGPLADPDRLVPADVVLRSIARDPPSWGDSRAKVIDRPQAELLTWSNLGAPDGLITARPLAGVLSRADSVPPVDEGTVNPTGFIADSTADLGKLSQTGDQWCIQAPGMDRVAFHPSGAVTDTDIARLRHLRAITVEWGRHTGPIAAVRTLVGLAAAGVPLQTHIVPQWAAALGSELSGLMTTVSLSELEDSLCREEHSIRLRRAAMRRHSTDARWRELMAGEGLPVSAPARISVLLCTKRPSQVGFALAQISRQRHVDLEVVLTLHGAPAAHPEVQKALADFDQPHTALEVPDSVVFGNALNRAVHAASGQYVAKWDDDDWYGPDFLADMSMAAHYSGADLVGCFGHLAYLEEIDLTVYRPEQGSEQIGRHIAGATLFMGRDDLLTLGGFRPLPRYVDTALQRAVTAAGGTVYRTHGLGFMFRRRAAGHTWDRSVGLFLRGSTRQWRGLRKRPLIDGRTPGGRKPHSKEIAPHGK